MSSDSSHITDSPGIEGISPTVVDTPVDELPAPPAPVAERPRPLDRSICGLLGANGPLLQQRLVDAVDASQTVVYESRLRLEQDGLVTSRPWIRDTRKQLVIPTNTATEGQSDD